MTDEEDKKLEALNQGFNDNLAMWGTACLGFFGVWFFGVFALAYIGLTFVPYIVVYVAAMGGLYFAFKKFKILHIIGLLFLICLTLLLSSVKLNWKKNYYESDAPFLLQAHIESVPAWEAHLLSPVLGVPDWFRFNEECAEPAINRQSVRSDCQNLAAINARYNLDMKKELDDYLFRMRHTAGLIKKQGSLTALQYKACVQKRECAEIPMLPADVTEETIDPENEEHLRISRVFWDLVDDRPLNEAICDYMTLCQVLKQTGAVSFE